MRNLKTVATLAAMATFLGTSSLATGDQLTAPSQPAQPAAATTASQSENSFVEDSQGNKAYIVELDESATTPFSGKAREDAGRFAPYQRSESVNLVLDVEREYHIHAHAMTSWQNLTFTSYLSDAQEAALSADARVKRIEPDVQMRFSSVDTTAVWSNVTLGSGEIQSWGKRAINQTTATSSGQTMVYVIDAGVGQHSDLNVVERVNPFTIPGSPTPVSECGSRSAYIPGTSTLIQPCSTAQLDYMVSCYTHSTAVAGIIGAKANGAGTQGIDPGVSIVSVSVLNPSVEQVPPNNTQNPNTFNSTYGCQNAVAFNTSDVLTALDWVASDISWNNHTGKPSVINISSNAVDSRASAMYTEMLNIAQSSPGAFIAQAAGNDFGDACSHAYPTTSTSDGIMVVGAINNHGQPVVPLNGLPGFFQNFGAFTPEAGSNYGSCVETWAPGENILSTIAAASDTSGRNPVYYQTATTVYSDSGIGSGTSFAAPHIAGLAAYFIETSSLTSASQVEAQMRSASIVENLGSNPAIGVSSTGAFTVDTAHTISIPTVNPLSGSVAHNTPYADFSVSSYCYVPPFGTPPAGTTCIQLPVNTPVPWSQPAPGFTGNKAVVRNGSTLVTTAPVPVYLFMDSYPPTPSCDADIELLPLGGGSTLATGAQYYNGGVNYGGGNVTWGFYSTNCPSATLAVQY